MAKYKCGHNGKKIFLRKNIVEFAMYADWVDSFGFNGNKKMCFECYVKRYKKE